MVDVTAALSGGQLEWLREAGARQAPPRTPESMLASLVDEAMARGLAVAHRRAEQLEVYRASGYAEHHPDYPNVPRGRADG